jgi:hypothetical protein
MDESESLLSEMAGRLAEVSNTDRYAPICLVPSGEIYHGDLMDQLPDAVIRDPGSWHLEPGLYASGPLGPVDLKHEHNQEGVFLFAGPAVETPQNLGQTDLVDVMPTSLALAGLKVPEGLDGTCRLEACDGSPPSYYETDLTWTREQLEGTFSEQEEAEVRDRLEKLGYL